MPPGVVTRTFTVPAACAGVRAVIVVSSTTTTFVASLPPNMTSGAPVKFVPVMVTCVPPRVGPLPGEIEVTVGGGST
jgi:hypothetical protein